MLRHTCLLLSSLFLSLALPAQENLRTPVVLIESGLERGTGILVGEAGGQLYLITAGHVVDDVGDIQVRFRNQRRATATLLRDERPALDLAILTCSVPAGMTLPQSYALAASPAVFRQEVGVIGHPPGAEWDVDFRPTVKEATYQFDPRRFSITPEGIGPGHSGGPVLDAASYDLLGMILSLDGRQAVCLQATTIEQVLRQRQVPRNLLQGIDEPPDRFSDYTDPLAGDMVAVEGGSFLMGSEEDDDEKPVHRVSVSDFYVGKYYEVTVTQYLAFCQATNTHWPEWLEAGNKYHVETGTDAYYKNKGYQRRGSESMPIVGVSWKDAIAYCEWLSQQTGHMYRLPSEAEWEYAAGGGASNRTKWAGTGNESSLGGYAWYGNNSNSKPHPVGEKQANRLGLYDMSGNLWEWCQDKWHDNYQGAPTDGLAWTTGTSAYRVYRGGSWFDDAGSCRVACRYRFYPDSRYYALGFRVARSS
jgi:formylglycine-generating enzyme required for sulfatase activity